MAIRIRITKGLAPSRFGVTLGVTLLGAMSLLGCRGNPSSDPPIHLQRNMFTQDKGKPQRENTFFADGRAMRPAVEGTVPYSIAGGDPREVAIEPGAYETGKDAAGAYVTKWPDGLSVDAALLSRGQERFNIYCAPCHDRTGSGNGAIIQRANKYGRWAPTSYYEDRIINMPVGQLLETITNGVRTMPSYAYQIPLRDRWAIVAYVRALQRSQHATVAEVPAEQRNNLK